MTSSPRAVSGLCVPGSLTKLSKATRSAFLAPSAEQVPAPLRALAKALHADGPAALDVALDAYLVAADGSKVFVNTAVLRSRRAFALSSTNQVVGAAA